MGGRAYSALVNGLATLASFGVICYGRDWDLISTLAADAISHDEARRGYAIVRARWGIDTFRQQRFKNKFRFEAEDVHRLMDELGFPGDEYWVMGSGSRFTREEAMLLYLRRLAYPTTLENLADEGFSAQPGQLSELYHLVGEWIFENHTKRLLQTGLTKWAARIPSYARAVPSYTGINVDDTPPPTHPLRRRRQLARPQGRILGPKGRSQECVPTRGSCAVAAPTGRARENGTPYYRAKTSQFLVRERLRRHRKPTSHTFAEA